MPGKTKKYSTLNAMLAGMERLFLMIMIGLVFPILLGLAGWWGSLPFVPESSIIYFALGGFMLGVLVDMVFLRFWTRNALRLPLIWPVLVYLFYSVGMFGFFMGVPAFNVVMGPVGGYYMGMRLRAKNSDKDEVEKTARQNRSFCRADPGGRLRRIFGDRLAGPIAGSQYQRDVRTYQTHKQNNHPHTFRRGRHWTGRSGICHHTRGSEVRQVPGLKAKEQIQRSALSLCFLFFTARGFLPPGKPGG